MHQVKILACNRNGNHRHNNRCAQALFKNYHISCIQESSFPNHHAFKTFQAQVSAVFNHHMFVNDQGATGRDPMPIKHGGVCTIIHADFFGVTTAAHLAELDVPNRYMVVRVMWESTPVYIHNVYAPVDSSERTMFFDELPCSFDAGALHIVCGDFNTPIDPDLDSLNPNSVHRASQQALLQWMWRLEVVDPWRIHHPDSRVLSGPGRVNRLDYVLVSHELQEQYFHSAKYTDPSQHQEPFSDHLLPSLTLQAIPCASKPGPWRAASWLLDDPEVQDWIVTYTKTNESSIVHATNPGLKWQQWKRSLTKQLKQRQQSYTLPALNWVRTCEIRLQELESAATASDAIREARETLVAALAAHNRVKTDISFKRNLVENENGSSYFFRPPTNSLNRSPITTALTPSGEVATSPWIVRHCHWRFWANVFRHEGYGDDDDATETDRAAARESLFAHSTARLSNEDRDILDLDLSEEDFVTAIKSMSPYKAPGYDGIPAKVYQLAPQLFARILLRVYQYQSQHGIMAPDQRRSIACLLFKKGDRSNPGNYRPISLIPVDVKIFARALTNRLRPTMNSLIHSDQSGFIKGRHIQHPLLALYDLQEQVTHLGREAYATMIDFEKAYDRVNWDYLWAVLRHFNFGENFVRWVKLLYTSTEVCLNVNGNILDAIKPTRGVKQGDPLSPLLFILALEPLCCAIRANATTGLHLPGLPTATGLYFADDATLLSDSLSGAAQQLEIVQMYCTSSGARLNIGKTTILPLNRNQTRHAHSDVRVLGSDERVRYLGLPVGQRVFHNDRLSTINTKFFSQFSIWKWRAKTLQGRSIVAQALMASQLWYCSAVTCIPPKLVTDWQRALNNYIVRAQTEPIKAPLMIASDWLYATPGRTTLRLPNVDRFIKRQHLNLLQQLVCARTHHSESFGWYSIPLSQLMAFQPPNEATTTVDFLWMPLSRKHLADHPGYLNSWWIEVMMTWKAWTKTLNLETLPKPERQRVYLTAPLWNNRYPLWQYQTSSTTRSLWRTSAPLVRHSLAKKGVSRLQDFLTPDNQWPTLDVFAATVYCATDLPNPQSRNIAFLYSQLTQIFNRLFPRGVDSTLTETPNTQLRPLWPWHVSTPLKTHWFPKIPSKILYASLADLREPTKTHPFQRHVLIDAPSTTQLQDHTRYLRKFINPRTLDVTIRVWWRILPVHYFFWRQGDQALRYCVHGCNDIESYHHLFWQCQHSSRLWRPILEQWRLVLDRPVTWNQALFGLDLSLKHRWQRQSRGVLLVWNITRSIVFSLLWQNRNLRKHQQKEPPDPQTQCHLVDNHLRTHLRHALHRPIAADDIELRNSLIRIVSVLAKSPFESV